jgi:membrane peptidoglycan carboxypeptidase
VGLNGAVVSEAWTLVLRKNAARAREIHFRARTVICWLIAVLAILLVTIELSSSWFEARLFSAVDRRLTFSVQPGASPAMVKPANGPYDERLGFGHLAEFTSRLESRQFVVAAQARTSAEARWLAQMGIFPTYHESSQAGLKIEGRQGSTLLESPYPLRTYPDYHSIPPLVVNTLLFIENRQLRDNSYPHRNPAIEWQRTGMAMIDLAVHSVDPKHQRVGGSTLATQLEKMRHSAGGQTQSVRDKFRQMISASLRAYQDGSDTRAAEEQIICDYLNSIPLAATPAEGEVHGLADGLKAWYGADVDSVNQLLTVPENRLDAGQMAAAAKVYRQVLSLLLAMRSPTWYLTEHRNALAVQTDRYLRVLAANGVISNSLRDAALKTKVWPQPQRVAARDPNFVADKAPNAIRMKLLPLLGIDNTYALDRLDLTVRTSLDASAQDAITRFLQSLSDPSQVTAAKMNADQLLDRGNPRSVIYSFTLYEHKGGANLLRVQTDNLDQPLDINEGTRLQLGSTAKLRTLILYLQIMAQLHDRYAGYSKGQLESTRTMPGDQLTDWALNYLFNAQDRSLRPMLEAALQRKYSGGIGEAFFTGGGLQTFENFQRSEDKQIFTVSEGFQLSVNLVFIRLLRDIENYYKYRVPGASPTVLTDGNDPARQRYLARFADMEGRAFLRRFYEKYKGQTPDQALETMASGIHLTPLRAAVIYRSVRPDDGMEKFNRFLKEHFPAAVLAKADAAKLYSQYGPDKFSLQDRGYLAHVHPLEL